MNIFNSLGSNYDFGFALHTLFAGNKKDNNQILKKYLENKYGGKVILTYKGREALRIALRLINLKNATVGICGFTCFAVYEAIVKEGYKVEYLDIEKDSLNFSPATFEEAVKKNPNIKIVFVQNTLGYPCDIEKIAKICQKNNIVLLEDLAHSIGTKYEYGKEAGTVGDFIMRSFSQDKVIDGVSGGALIVRNSKNKFSDLDLHEMRKQQQKKDIFYPLLTVLIRKSYDIWIGKILHFFLKKLNVLSNPMFYSDMQNLHSLPAKGSDAVLNRYKLLEKNINHRKKIATIYAEQLNKKILSKKICNSIYLSSNLRFPVFLDHRKNLISFLKKEGVFVSDIWYDTPIAPKRYLEKTNYSRGLCPNAEYVSEKILNLPTHINLSESDAKNISEKINLWLKSQ